MDFDLFLKTALESTGLNWRKYHRRNIKRRVVKRMGQRRVAEFHRYLELLQADEAEFQVFYGLLTVTVTRFFRDPDVFDTIKNEVLPAVIAGKAEDEEVKVWSIGCASGEEPYSMAIMWEEYFATREGSPRLSIIATDIDRQCLARAGQATYESSSIKQMPDRLVGKYFRHEGSVYALARNIIERVKFTRHDILSDPPIKRTDLVLCRNLAFTYFLSSAQGETVRKIHGSLGEGGFFVIGKKETLTPAATGLFEPFEPSLKIFRSVTV